MRNPLEAAHDVLLSMLKVTYLNSETMCQERIEKHINQEANFKPLKSLFMQNKGIEE